MVSGRSLEPLEYRVGESPPYRDVHHRDGEADHHDQPNPVVEQQEAGHRDDRSGREVLRRAEELRRRLLDWQQQNGDPAAATLKGSNIKY